MWSGWILAIGFIKMILPSPICQKHAIWRTGKRDLCSDPISHFSAVQGASHSAAKLSFTISGDVNDVK